MKQIKVITILIGLFFLFSGFLIKSSFAENPKKIKMVFMNPFGPTSNYSFSWSAQRRYWPEENIEAEVLDGRGGQDAIQAVASGSAQAALGIQDVLKGIQQGMPIKIIAVAGQNDGNMIYTLKSSGITSLKDFEGKKISVFPFGTSLTAEIKIMLKRSGVNLDTVQFINVTPGDDEKWLLAGKTDAAGGKIGYQDMHLACKGYETVVFPGSKYGFDFYEFFIIVNTEWEKEIGYDRMVGFLRGIAKGYLLRKTNIEQSVDDMIYYRPMERALKKLRLAEFWTFLPRLMSPDIDKYGWGVITEEKMIKTQDVLVEIGTLNEKIDVRKYYDERYLKDPSVHKIAMEFARVPMDPKAEEYLKGCREK